MQLNILNQLISVYNLVIATVHYVFQNVFYHSSRLSHCNSITIDAITMKIHFKVSERASRGGQAMQRRVHNR